MLTITQYEIRRSGATMTISGKDRDGESVVITQVVRVKSGAHVGPETGHMMAPVATTKHGDEWALV